MFAKDYRKQAWNRLRGNWGATILAFLLYSLIIGALSFTGIGTIILTGPLYVGMVAVFVQLARTGTTKIEHMFEGFTTGFVNKMLGYILVSIFTALWALLFWIPGIVKSFSYAMTYYILNDNPEMSANDAITRSREMMDGHKWQLFCLRLSFIGWILLSCLTFGVLMIVVMPYMQAAEAEFYEKLKNDELAAKGITAEATFVEEPVAETTESN
jgi:uncharacterized membrane protein